MKILTPECTFILLDPALPDTAGTGHHGGGMVGDVNLFLNDADEPTQAEIEIMIAEKGSRRKGLAQEAVTLFMAYAVKHLVSTHHIYHQHWESPHFRPRLD